MAVFPLVIADFEQDMPGIEPWPLDWYTSALTTELQEERQYQCHWLLCHMTDLRHK